MRMKLVVASWGEPTNEKTWSKTPSILVSMLKDRGVEVSSFNLCQFETFLVKIFTKILRKLFVIRILPKSFLVHYYYERKFDDFVQNNKDKKILFVSEHCSKRAYSGVEQYVYIDAVLRPICLYDDKTSNFAKKQLPSYETVDKRSLASMTKIFTQNQWTKDFIVKEYGINKDKVINIHFGVNLLPLTSNKDYSKNLLLIVLRKGTERLKGLKLLLEAFPKIKQSVPTAELAVVGTKGPKIKGVRYYYKQPRETTVALFKECTLYTMPALFEPNGITYLEALANKAPIVGLNRFAFPEFAGYGKYGFIVDNADKDLLANTIIEALSDKKKLEIMGINGQQYVLSNFSWDKTVSSILENIHD